MSSEKPTSPPLADLKEALSSHRKPDITHVRTPLLNYCARGCEYGDDVYERANYLRPVAPGGYTGTPTAEDFKRCRAYMRALVSHGFKVLDAMEHHQATDPKLEDIDGMKRAVFAADEDASDTATRKGIGPSRLPHLAHLASSLNMVLTQAAACGLLPADPGRTWQAVAALARDAMAATAEPLGEASITSTPFDELTRHYYLADHYPASDCARQKCGCSPGQVTVANETFRTLSPGDTRHRASGYRSGQDLNVDVPNTVVAEPGPYWPPPTRPEGPL